MSKIEVGSVVSRKSYNSDVHFKVIDIIDNIAILKGICYRIQADALISDLILVPPEKQSEYKHSIDIKTQMRINSLRSANSCRGNNIIPGNVLHVDGDFSYMRNCIYNYNRLNIPAVGKAIAEKDQPRMIYNLLVKYNPDILVITGHDSILKKSVNYLDLNNYKNSKYFVEAVKEARRFQNSFDKLAIFAGACQSAYNRLISIGANFASSPYRVLIHELDPVYICQKIAYTPKDKILNPVDVVNNTITGYRGIGGIRTRGHGTYFNV